LLHYGTSTNFSANLVFFLLGGDRQHAQGSSEYINTKSLIVNGDQSYISLPAEWAIQEIASVTFSFEMPPGSIDNCILQLSKYAAFLE